MKKIQIFSHFWILSSFTQIKNDHVLRLFFSENLFSENRKAWTVIL